MDAGLAPGSEVTVDFEGVAGAALVGINPVLACGEANSQTLVSATSPNRYKLLYPVEKNLASK